MAKGIINLQLKLNPELNAKQLALQMNALIKQLQSSLGPLSKGITPIDVKGLDKDISKINKQFRDTANGAKKANENAKGLGGALKGAANQATLLGKAFQFNQVAQSLQVATQAFAPFLNEFVEFDKQIKNIGTLGVENFQAYEPLLTDLAAKIPGTAADMANGVYQAISAGVQGSAEDITNFVEVAAKVGVAGMSDTSSAVDGLTSVLNAYGRATDEAGAVADTFFAGIKLGKTSFEEMNSSIASFVPSASAMGVSFEQATAAIARYTALGTPTAQVGTQMNAVFTLLAKGTAPLNKALEANGTSLDILRNKLKQPVEAGGGLVNVMREIKLAADNSGQQLASLTGRVEAAKIIESLAGDTDKYTASLETFGKVQEEIQAGAAEQAFQVAATSVQAQTDGALATVQGIFNAAFSAMGSGATSALNTITQLSPALIGISSAASLIPKGPLVSAFATAAEGAAHFAANIAKRVLPGLAAQHASTVVGATGFRAMWLAATGPVGLIIAGLAAVGTAVYFLVDALVETKEEQLEATKAQEEYIQGQVEANQTAQKQIETNKNLIANYERLSQKTNLTAQEQDNLDKTVVALSRSYPGAIDATKSFEDNMISLSAAAQDEKAELENLKNELNELNVKAGETAVARLNLEADIQAEDLADKLDDEIANFVRVDGKAINSDQMIQGYVDSIQNAQNSNDVRKAVTEFGSALYSSEGFKDVPPEIKAEVLNNIKELGEQRNAVIDEQNKLNLEKTNQALKSLVNQSNTDVDFKISDDAIKNIAEQFNQSEDQVRASLEKMQDDARNVKVDEILTEAFQINQEIDKQGRIEELLEQYKTAGDEIEKANISNKIAELAPEAVTATGTIKDANGDLVKTYEVLEDQVLSAGEARKEALSDDLLSKQQQIVDEINKEGQGYEKNKTKLQEIQDQINSAVKADPSFDTTELEAEYNKLKNRNQETQDDIIDTAQKWIVTGNDANQVYEQVGKSLGIPVDEAKNLVDESLKAKNAVEEIKEETDSLGESFNKALGEARKSYQENVNALANLYGQLREAESEGDKEKIKSIKDQISEQKSLNIESKKALDVKESDLKNAKKLTEQEKTRFQLAEAEFKATEKRIKKQQTSFEIDEEMNLILQQREKTQFDDLRLNEEKLSTLEKQRKALFDTFKLVENEDGSIEFGMSLKKEEKDKLQDQVTSINNQISKQENSILKIQTDIELKEEEVQEKLREFERKNLEFQISIGVKDNSDLLDVVNADLKDVQDEIKDKQLRLFTLNLNPSENAAEILQIKEQLTDLRSTEIDLKKESSSIINEIYDEDLKILQAKHDEELALVQNRIDQELALRNILVDSTAIALETNIADKYNSDIAKLEDAKERELLTEETYNKRKEELEKQHQKKLNAIASIERGQRLEAERQANLASLNETLSHQEKYIELLIDKAKKEEENNGIVSPETQAELSKLRYELSQTEQDIAEKSSLISAYSQELSDNITLAFSNVGDPEAVREGFRALFSVIAGALSEYASAQVTKAILAYFGEEAVKGNLFLSLALLPAAAGLAKAATNAILQPVLNGLLSFSTGGRVDEPTVAVIGDASKSRPGPNTEWILRDDQIAWIIDQSLKKNNYSFAGIFSSEITRVVTAIKESDANLSATLVQEMSHLYSSNELKEIATNMNSGMSELKYFLADIYKHNDKSVTDDLLANIRSSYNQYSSNRISKSDYQDTVKNLLRNLPSYAEGSGFIDQPQVALIGDAGANNPEIVQNKAQLTEMLIETSFATANQIVKPLESKIDTLINVLIDKPMGIRESEVFEAIKREELRRKSNVRA